MTDTSRTRRDPTAVSSQPALTTATGTNWLIVGGLFTAIALALLLSLTTLPGSGMVGIVAAVVVAVLYLGMLVARFALPAGRRRLGTLAAGMLTIAGVSLVSVVIAAVGAWSDVPA